MIMIRCMSQTRARSLRALPSPKQGVFEVPVHGIEEKGEMNCSESCSKYSTIGIFEFEAACQKLKDIQVYLAAVLGLASLLICRGPARGFKCRPMERPAAVLEFGLPQAKLQSRARGAQSAAAATACVRGSSGTRVLISLSNCP